MSGQRRQPRELASARAYYRLAVKADMAGRGQQADTYRRKADHLVRTYRDRKAWAERARKA